MSIIIYLRPADDCNPPLPRPDWPLIDAVAATLGLPPYLRLLPGPDGAR